MILAFHAWDLGMLISGSNQPRVGIGVFVLNSKNQFLLGKRKGSIGSGTWALPGGHLEYGESFETCAERETLEETGLEVKNTYFWTATNSIWESEEKHYVTIFMVCQLANEEATPENSEPDKCERWQWVTWNQMKTWASNRNLESQNEHEQFQADQKDRQLFRPLLSLLQQRPDLALAV